mgnify:CR=1 FL=1
MALDCSGTPRVVEVERPRIGYVSYKGRTEYIISYELYS